MVSFLLGIDETPESLVAAAEAGLLRASDGQLVLLAVAESYLAAQAGLAAVGAGDHLVAGASTNLERAKELVDTDDAVLAEGRLVPMLCAACSRSGATLIAVGVRPHRRPPAMTFGGHEVEALHDARCSVLIARPGWGPSKPERIVVGVDGSSEARTAEAVARTLAVRVGCEVVPVVALTGRLRKNCQSSSLIPKSTRTRSRRRSATACSARRRRRRSAMPGCRWRRWCATCASAEIVPAVLRVAPLIGHGHHDAARRWTALRQRDIVRCSLGSLPRSGFSGRV